MTASPHKRILPLATGHNFRDLGGYPAMNGRTVRWRQVFRSGFMSRISGEDIDQLHALGINSICDFRANDERRLRPTRWHEGSEVDLWVRDYHFSAGAIAELIENPAMMAENTFGKMIEIYRELPTEQAESYGEMFRRIASGRLPLVFNCSAGKDRTGVAAALLLTLLGVPHDTVIEDYLMTNDYLPGLIAFMEQTPKYAEFVTERREHALPLLRAEPEYLDATFDVLKNQYGTVDTYAKTVLGLNDAEIDSIRTNLLD